VDKIQKAHQDSKYIYGSPRITAELHKKAEMVYHRKFMDQQSAKLEVFGYIEGFYNAKRIHSALGYKTPKQMEEMLLEKDRLAA